jgi:serine/threonine-protein kinase
MVNKEAEIARSELTSAGFKVIDREQYDETGQYAKGMVIKTEPEAGTEYPEGKEVQIFISQGQLETEVKVPDVVGMTQAKAISALKENKLTYEIVEMKQDGNKGKVVEQSIDAGTYVTKQTSVTIYVSTGEADPTNLTMSIPMPEGIHGSYTIDVYRDGSVAYTKTVTNGEAVAGGNVNIDISGKKTETLVVYIKNNDNTQDNYVQYAKFDIDYDAETVTLNGSVDSENLLKVTPETTTTPTTSDSETTTTPATTQEQATQAQETEPTTVATEAEAPEEPAEQTPDEGQTADDGVDAAAQ